MMHSVCLTRPGSAYERLGALIDEAVASFRFTAEELDLPVRYRVKVWILPPQPGSKKAHDLDLRRRCWVHTQFHAETIANTRPRKAATA